MKVVEYKKIGVRKLLEKIVASACAWNGCSERFMHADGMPDGWQWVIVYHDTKPTIMHWTNKEWVNRPYTDVALCPKHTAFLLSSFKGADVPNFDEALRMATEGNA